MLLLLIRSHSIVWAFLMKLQSKWISKKTAGAKERENPAILNNKKIKIMEDKRYVLAAVFRRQLSGESVAPHLRPEFLLKRAAGPRYYPPTAWRFQPLSLHPGFCAVQKKKKNSWLPSKGYVFSFKVNIRGRFQCEESAWHMTCLVLHLKAAWTVLHFVLIHAPKGKSTLK